ncbi:MAG: Na/Pi cotransporter family protein [Oscillospiraceae bacterium]|nr:Na/Pi cotransporter family protein [Oscillospiraceae bacterium]
MTIFDALQLIGGLCLFLFGMNIMGQALERRAGGKLQSLLGKLTTNKFAGLLTGLGVTAIIQSSSATTVMVVGFVNSGIMTLKQAINVIMGANIGTTVTAWILSLGGISGDNIFIKLLKPTSFTPILALIGIIFYMFCKSDKKKDTGTILLGFAVLMFGMDSMSSSVSGLAEVEGFKNLFIMFKNPILGVLAGAVLTAVIQSSSASVGILQALATTGLVSYGAAIPIIMGQNIGTCITAMLSSLGTNRNAKRSAVVHLSFNIIGTIVCLTAFCIVKATLAPALLDDSASLAGIAVAHSVFNIACTAILFPMSSILEKVAYKLVPETQSPDVVAELDERFLATPSIALERCHELSVEMAREAIESIRKSIMCLRNYTPELAKEVRELEDKTDHYEDIIGTYLVKLSTHQVSDAHSAESSKLLKIIGDLERISDHAVNIVVSSEEMNEKKLTFSDSAEKELDNLLNATDEILSLTLESVEKNDASLATDVEPLEEIIDKLKESLRTGHIIRLQQKTCSIETGFVWSDILTNLERVSDHCSNVAGCIIDALAINLNIHESLRATKAEDPHFKEKYSMYAKKYLTAVNAEK